MDIVEKPQFIVDGKSFDSRDEAEAHMKVKALTAKAEQFAVEHLSDGENEKQPAVRSITRTVNVIVAWEQWNARGTPG